jgi:hypothetical protein
MKTAKEFFKDKEIYVLTPHQDTEEFLYQIHKSMIEFAQMHVEAALEKAAEEVNMILYIDDVGEYNHHIDRESILKAYPTDLIK